MIVNKHLIESDNNYSDILTKLDKFYTNYTEDFNRVFPPSYRHTELCEWIETVVNRDINHNIKGLYLHAAEVNSKFQDIEAHNHAMITIQQEYMKHTDEQLKILMTMVAVGDINKLSASYVLKAYADGMINKETAIKILGISESTLRRRVAALQSKERKKSEEGKKSE